MNLYEHIFMARQDISAQQVEELTEHFKAVLAKNEGEVGKIENWGLKNLAFRINKNRKAHYVLMNITALPAAIAELERQMRLHEDILRYLTVKVAAHESEPSAMLRKEEKIENKMPDDDDIENILKGVELPDSHGQPPEQTQAQTQTQETT